MVKESIVLLLVLSLLGANDSLKDDDESRPYEFGFTIDGEQHRYEKKDIQGIVQGEFGFITGDGIYHVTVYATDENGDFKIISMKNTRISEPLDQIKTPLTTGGLQIRRLNQSQTPASPAPLKALLPNDPPILNNEITPKTEPKPALAVTTRPSPDFTTATTIRMGCSGCGIVATPPTGPLPFQNPVFHKQDSEKVNKAPYNNDAPFTSLGKPAIALGEPFGQDKPFGINDPITAPKNPIVFDNFDVNPQVYLIDPRFNPSSPGANANNPTGTSSPKNNPPVNLKKPSNHPNSVTNPNTSKAVKTVPLPLQFSVLETDNPNGITNKPLRNGNFQKTNPISQPPKSVLSQLTVDNGAINIPGNEPLQIEDKYPNMVNGLPNGITERDVTDLLYKFNYTLGFHGHYEKGLRNGGKIGGYFVNGRDGYSRVVTYVADENGYRPKFKLINLGLDSPDTPKADSEKKFGLKSFEFVWYPV